MGHVAGALWEGCVTDPSNLSRIVSFFAVWNPSRPFPIDMASFAVNLNRIIQNPEAQFDHKTVGLQEGLMLGKLGFKNAYQLEPKANGCNKVGEFFKYFLSRL